MTGVENIVVQHAAAPFSARAAEICEHKGIGHPDTIADGVCEAAAVALAREYRRAFGQILHFNVDKALLIAGASEPCFGGGRIVTPATLIVCGRASNPDGHLDIDEIVASAARDYIRRSVPAAEDLLRIAPNVKEGSTNLKQLYPLGKAVVYRANDTSFGAGYAPLSPLEGYVLRLAGVLRSAEFHAMFPAAGDDYKVMGLRIGNMYSVTVALAMIDRHVRDAARYFAIKDEMTRVLRAALPQLDELVVNALDDPRANDTAALYLTVSGLSAEMGDDGQVGRGNRVNGLITPGRPMSLEAAAGKNPAAHVGKIYNVLASEIAQAICAQLPDIEEANVELVSRIGQPLDAPQLVALAVVARDRLTPKLEDDVRAVVREKLKTVDALTARLERGEIPVY